MNSNMLSAVVQPLGASDSETIGIDEKESGEFNRIDYVQACRARVLHIMSAYTWLR